MRGVEGEAGIVLAVEEDEATDGTGALAEEMDDFTERREGERTSLRHWTPFGELRVNRVFGARRRRPGRGPSGHCPHPGGWGRRGRGVLQRKSRDTGCGRRGVPRPHQR